MDIGAYNGPEAPSTKETDSYKINKLAEATGSNSK